MDREKEKVMSEKTNKGAKSEIYALRPTPENERKSMWDIVWVLGGVVICIPAFMLGGLVAAEMPTWEGIAACIIGYLFVLVLMLPLGVQGADLGVPTCAIAPSVFGIKGTRLLVSSLFAISLIGFFGLQVNVCGEAFSNLIADAFGIEIPVMVSSLLWGVIMSAIAIIGMEGLKIFDVLSVPMLFIIMVLGLVLAFRKFGTEGIEANEVTQSTMSFAQAVGLSFSFFSASAFTAADVNRWQRNRKETIQSCTFGLMPAGIATCVIGVLLSRVAGEYDITLVLSKVGIPVLGLVVLILASVSTNSLNAYCGGLDTIMTFNLPDNRRREATAGVCIIGVVLALTGILNYMETFLNWICFLSAPVAGIMIADYWIIGKGKPESWHQIEGWNWMGIIVALVSMVLALIAYNVFGIGVFNLNGVVIAMVLYLIVERFVPSLSRNLDGGIMRYAAKDTVEGEESA